MITTVKAQFDVQQPLLTSITLKDNQTRIFICQNEEEIEVTYPTESGEATKTAYVYDMTEVLIPTDTFDKDLIETDPDGFIESMQEVEATQEERITQLEADVEYIAMCAEVEL